MAKTKVIIAGLSILCLCFVAFYHSTADTTLSNTPQPTPVEMPMPEKGTTGSKDTSMVTQASSSNIPKNTSQVLSKTNAPKQESIKLSVSEEKTYYTLAESNDTYTTENWMLDTIQTTETWATMPQTGSVIAVIDSGFALDHEDLVAQWHANSGEAGTTQLGDPCWNGTPENKQTNNCDDDENGYIDDWRGWDFYSIDNTPQAGTLDPAGEGATHGSLVAGLVAAETNNGVGIASVGKFNTIMPLQVMGDDGIGYTSDITAAVYYAVDNGAKVINMSLGGGDYDIYLETALNYAEENGVIVVAASGNCGDSITGYCSGLPAGGMTFPARYSNVIAVGASTQENLRASFSSYGAELDVVAPGSGSLISTNWTAANQISSYATNLHGTSFASPIVASIAGIVAAAQPDSSVATIKSILIANAQKVSALGGNIYTEALGHGVINASTATNLALETATPPTKPIIIGQSGNHVSEHRYTRNTTQGSNCTTDAEIWCSVWAKSTQGHDRYLPYKKTASSGMVSWSWNSAILGTRSWNLRTISGGQTSTAYLLIHK